MSRLLHCLKKRLLGIITAAAIALVLMLGTIAFWACTDQPNGRVWCFVAQWEGEFRCIFVSESVGRTALRLDAGSNPLPLPPDCESRGPAWSLLAQLDLLEDPRQGETASFPYFERGFGLPLRCFAWDWTFGPQGIVTRDGIEVTTPRTGQFITGPVINGLPEVRFCAHSVGIFPTRVHWFSFLVDWIVWTIPVWLFGAGLVRANRWNRRRRGRCGWCAYDLRGLKPGAVCPECGKMR